MTDDGDDLMFGESHLEPLRRRNMFEIRRLFHSVSCLGFVLFFVSGCPSAPAGKNTTTQPLRGQEVEFLAPKSLNLPVFWEVLLQEWSSQTGASTKIVDNDFDDVTTELTEIAEGAAGRFVLFPLNKLPEIGPQLTSIPASEQFDSKDLFKGLRDRILSREQQLIAFPISVPVFVCYYRQDLLRAARLKPPETWDEYNELIGSLQTWAPGLVAVEPLGPQYRATTFFAKTLAYCKHPENYSVWFDIDTAKPTFNSPGFIEGLETARRTWARLPKEVATYSPAECRRLLLAGKAAITLAWEPQSSNLVARSQGESTPEVHRIDGIELGVCRLPGSRRVFNRNSKKWDTLPTVHSPALCGFAGLAVGVMLPKKPTADNAALSFLNSLSTTALFDEAFSALPKGPCRESQVSLSPSWFGPELSTEEASMYTDAVGQSLRDMQLVAELPVHGADEFRQATSNALEKLLNGETDTEQTLQLMQSSFESIVERLGRDTVRDSYRRGLGMSLPPRK